LGDFFFLGICIVTTAWLDGLNALSFFIRIIMDQQDSFVSKL
jgi:hypothetical protein